MRARRAWFSQVRARMLLNRGHTGSSGSCRGPSWLPIANLPPAAEQREKQKPRQLLQRRVERKGLSASLSSEAPTNRSINLLLFLCSLLLTAAAAAAGTTHCSCCCCCLSVFVCVCACVACYTPFLSIHIHKRSWPISLISRAPLRACARWSSTTSCLLYVVSLLLLVVVLVAIVQQLPPPRCTPADRPCHHQQASELFDHLEGALALHAAESNSNAELRAQGTRTWPNHVSDLSRSRSGAARAGARCPTSIRSHQLLVCAS